MSNRQRATVQTAVGRIVLAVALLVAGLPRTAQAGDLWSAPYPGVRLLHRLAPGVDVRMVFVDLTHPAVSIVATHPGDHMSTVSEFAARYEADIAINANFFDRNSCGLMAGGGEVADQSYDDMCGASMGFGRDNQAAVFDSLAAIRGPVPASWMTEVLTGKPFLMRNGRALLNWTRPQHLYRPNPRTALGLTSDRHTLIILSADGRRRNVPGLTGFQMVALMREFDVADAINLDGGGSTELVMEGRVRNHPSDGNERLVLSHLGVRIRPGVTWNAATLMDHGNVEGVVQGQRTTVWLTARNTGRATWFAERDGGGSPVLELDDGTIGYTASVHETTPPGAIGRFEIEWLARGAGHRTLRARLLAPDGAPLDDAPTLWSLAVDPDTHALHAAPQRAVAIARATEVVFPVGLGAVQLRAGSCRVGPTPARARGGWIALMMVGAWMAVGAAFRRRRGMGGVQDEGTRVLPIAR